MNLLAAILCIVPLDRGVARESCDCIEVNHFYSETGDLVFTQAIYRDWSAIRAWRLVKHPNQLPARDWEHGGYVTTWLDGDTLRQVRAGAIRETWTQFDPELNERDCLPVCKRRELKTKGR